MRPRLLIFDIDGTLIDSQAHILAAMEMAFSALDRPAPGRAAVLSIVGLSLPVAMARLAPDADAANCDALVRAYKDGFAGLRADGDPAATSPLFPGAGAALASLSARDDLLLGVATGKSRRGLAHVFELHDVADLFHTVQTADDHPSKPNPAMIHACLAETGIDPGDAAILGDTTYDIEMGRAAGIAAIGVSWGYHPVGALHASGAQVVLDRFDRLPAFLDELWTDA